jgi:hypothetical protein
MARTCDTRMPGIMIAIALASMLGGCVESNAYRQQILSGYQPGLEITNSGVTGERTGDNEFVISLRRIPEVEVQKNSTWCWATCVAALYNYELPVTEKSRLTQDDIIRAMAAHSSKQSASEIDILVALAPDVAKEFMVARDAFEAKPHRIGFLIVGSKDGYFEADLPRRPGAECIVDELAQGKAVLVAIDPAKDSMGHIVVATSVKFSMASTDVAFGTRAPYFIHEIRVIDPRNGEPATYKAEGEKSMIDRIAFASSRETAEAYLRLSTKAYRTAKWVPLRK